jgi:hypothetical protein
MQIIKIDEVTTDALPYKRGYIIQISGFLSLANNTTRGVQK